jgi:hypothetical protein
LVLAAVVVAGAEGQAGRLRAAAAARAFCTCTYKRPVVPL